MVAVTKNSVQFVSHPSFVEVIAMGDKSAAKSVVGNFNAKMVRFANPPVTRSWVVERAPMECKQSMYYSAKDILRFKLERKLQVSEDHALDQAHCESIIQNLDRAGLRNFRQGNYVRALNAFVTALRLRTRANIDLDPKAISNNIHCIADIYNKQKDFVNALNAYQGSLDAIQARSGEDDVLRTMISLRRKMALVKIQLGTAKALNLKL